MVGCVVQINLKQNFLLTHLLIRQIHAQVEQSDDGTSTIILRNIEHSLSGEVKCAVVNRQNRKVFNEFYANLTVLPQLNDYSECNHTYFGLFSGVNSVIEDQSVYITKKPDDIKTTVGETIRIEVRFLVTFSHTVQLENV